ncbi:hypothetical protein GM1_002_01540 [Gordonia malaquae NBRC 108250]|uniref:Uncharacterized protein n=1 Tax=Gordonia malaquae NBRC 108250 TaxID=1223542 RepID=M3T9T2_GORML|nr:hypothetical protein GM1_002_01540 [Gordonia malaquae NBRC 108250]
MKHEHHDGLVGGRVESDADRERRREVESGRRGRVQSGFVGRHPVESVERVRGRGDHLHATAVDSRVGGAQHLVSAEHVADCGAQRVDVEAAPDPEDQRDVVGRGLGVEAVDEPHTLLRE